MSIRLSIRTNLVHQFHGNDGNWEYNKELFFAKLHVLIRASPFLVRSLYYRLELIIVQFKINPERF